jgi:hypothetical protein
MDTHSCCRSLEGTRHLFADGNVSHGFESFETDHVCNKFCRFFELRTDYSNWGPAPAVESSQSTAGMKSMDISTVAQYVLYPVVLTSYANTWPYST